MHILSKDKVARILIDCIQGGGIGSIVSYRRRRRDRTQVFLVVLFVIYMTCAAGESITQNPRVHLVALESEAKESSTAENNETAKPARVAPDLKIETIEVKTEGVYDARREDTASKIVISEAEIRNFGDTQLADVLKRLPGITVQGSNIRMRGLGNGYTQILIDGDRPPSGFAIDQLSPSMIERIEIIRAAVAEFSTRSIAGTINIVLKKKISSGQREITLASSQRNAYTSQNFTFAVTEKIGEFAYSITGNAYQSHTKYSIERIEENTDAEDFSILYRVGKDNTDGKQKTFGLNPRIIWTINDGQTITWQNAINITHGNGMDTFQYDIQEGLTPLNSSSRSKNKWTNDFERSDLNWVKLLQAGGKFDVKAGFQYGNTTNYSSTDGFNSYAQQNLIRIRDTSTFDNSIIFSGKYSTPLFEGHSLLIGWDSGLNKRNEHSIQQDTSIPHVLPRITPFDSDEHFKATISRFALFAQDDWALSNQSAIYWGLRWEEITTASEGETYATVTNRSSVTSPIFQMLYKLADRKGEQLRFAMTRTYKSPTTAQLIPRRFTSIENRPNSPDNQGNPNLKPELADGVDIAYEKFWDKGTSLSFSYGLRKIKDYNRQALLFMNSRWILLPINDGKAISNSIEFDTKLSLQKIYPSGIPIDFRFNMNRNWSRVESVPKPNNRLDQQTPFSATFGIDYRKKNSDFAAGSSFSFKSGGWVRISLGESAYQIVKRDLDAYALWKVSTKTQLRLTISNLLKSKVTSTSLYADESGSSLTTLNNPSKVNFRVSLEMKL